MYKGFTLIEIIITIVIIGILSNFAYINYINYMTIIRRSDGKTSLIDLAVGMEQHYFTNHTYANATIGTGTATDIKNQNLSSAGWYHLAIIKHTKNHYILEAIANNTQLHYDKRCKSLTIDSVGNKNPRHCWQH